MKIFLALVLAICFTWSVVIGSVVETCSHCYPTIGGELCTKSGKDCKVRGYHCSTTPGKDFWETFESCKPKGCKDTPSWDNGSGIGCELYEKLPDHCRVRPSDFNNPHLNCCVCGKTDCADDPSGVAISPWGSVYECKGNPWNCGDSWFSNSCRRTCGTCDQKEFQCKNGETIQASWRCDKEDDCGDNSDEQNCDYDRCFDVKLTTVSYGSEISWSLGSCQGNGKYGNNAEYTEQCCLEPGNYNLECKDSYGDGWNGGYIEVNGEKYCESFSSRREETEIIIEGNE